MSPMRDHYTIADIDWSLLCLLNFIVIPIKNFLLLFNLC